MQTSRGKIQTAFDAGRDCALNGANTENCHFRWFATPELLAEWERGKASAPKQEVDKEVNNG